MVRPGERHIEQSEILPERLVVRHVLALLCLLLRRPVLRRGDVEGPLTGDRALKHHVVVAALAPQSRDADNGKLEALGHVDRHDLHRLGLGLHLAGRHVVVRVDQVLERIQLREGREQSQCCRSVTVAVGLQQAGEVVEVGQVAITVWGGEHPCHDPAVGPDVGTEVDRAMGLQNFRPAEEVFLHVGELGFVGRVNPGYRPPEEP